REKVQQHPVPSLCRLQFKTKLEFPLVFMDPEPESAVTKVNLGGYAHLLRTNANFRRLWMAQIISEIGDWFYTLAIYTLLLQLTGQAGSVAMALVLQVLPQTFIGPAAGVVNDRIRRKRVMITADLARMAIVLAMLFVRSRSTVWLVYPLLLLETMMAAFFEPARSSVIPNITTREDLVQIGRASCRERVYRPVGPVPMRRAVCNAGRRGARFASVVPDVLSR